jgi:adenylate kinase
MQIAMLGSVGVGKGTQAQRISERLNYTRVATGDLVRDQIEADTELGRELRQYSDRGEPAPDDLILKLTRPHLLPAGGWILDGFPRTLAQARALDEALEERSASLDRVIVLEGADYDTLVERVTGGRRQSLATGRVYHMKNAPPPAPETGWDPGPFVQREDDREEALRRQLEAYHQEADRIKQYYEEQGILAVVDAGQDLETIAKDIIQALGNPARRGGTV